MVRSRTAPLRALAVATLLLAGVLLPAGAASAECNGGEPFELLSPSSAAVRGEAYTIRFVDDECGSSFAAYLDGVPVADWQDGLTQQYDWDRERSVHSFVLDSTLLDNGSHVLTVTHEDPWRGLQHVDTEVVVDNHWPTISITSPAQGARISGRVPFTVQAAAVGIDPIGLADVKFYVDGRYLTRDFLPPYSVTLDAASLLNGPHGLTAVATDSSGLSSTSPTRSITTVRQRPPAARDDDYNGDGKADIGVFRPATGTWHVRGMTTQQFGLAGDKPVPGDYDGDGKTDLAVFRPSNGTWYVKGISTTAYGAAEGDVPVPGDYNGDGRTDIAVWRPSNGTWYVKGMSATSYGANGDRPVPADYNGDGRTDLAVFRPSNGTWYVRGISTATWGRSGDVPVSGDYNGDRVADLAVWRPSTGTWYVRGLSTVPYGAFGDKPVTGDYTGDGKTDIAVWRPSNGTWYLRGITAHALGRRGDLPL